MLGGEQAVDSVVQNALTPSAGPARQPLDVDALARAVLTTLEHDRATWQLNHVRAETERQVRSHAAVPDFRADQLDQLVDTVVEQVLSPALSVPLTARPQLEEPAMLRRSDGTSVYEIAGAARYSSPAILDAERTVLALADRLDGRRVTPSAVSLALLELSANGLTLGADQATMVRDLATSGARVQLALAPAGTGKTVAMRALATAWTADGGSVIGLAPSAGAAQILRGELAHHAVGADTLAKLVDAVSTGRAVPNWAAQIGPDTLVIIDEAGMAGTLDLAAAVKFVVARGGSVRLVGDTQQLAAIGAGGLLRDIDRTHGAVTLDTVRRFTHPDGRPNHGEAAASLALRDGDPTAIAYYTDHGRIHVGDATTTLEQAYQRLDRRPGSRTRQRPARPHPRPGPRPQPARSTRPARRRPGARSDARSVSSTARARPSATPSSRATTTVGWRPQPPTGSPTATAGRSPPSTPTAASTSPTPTPADGPPCPPPTSASTCSSATPRPSTPPKASPPTPHTPSPPARRTGACSTSGSPADARPTTSISTSPPACDPDDVTHAEAVHPSTAVEILTRALARDDAVTSATSEQHTANDPALLLGKQVAQYLDALDVAAHSIVGPDNLARLTAGAEQIVPGVTACDAWPTLQNRLVMIGLDGPNPYDALQRAADRQDLTGSADLAAVLAWRLQPDSATTPPPSRRYPPSRTTSTPMPTGTGTSTGAAN